MRPEQKYARTWEGGERKVGGGKREQQEKYCQTEIDTSLHSNLLQKKMLAPKKALWE